MNVFVFWECPPGQSIPPYILTCLKTIRQACYRDCCFHLVTPDNFDKYVPDHLVHPRWKTIKELGVKSDVVRAACLAQWGGLYVDADTIMLKSPTEAGIDESVDCACMTWSTPPDRVIAGYAYCSKAVGKLWLDNINKKLEQGRHGWTELGEGCLTPVVRSLPANRVQQLPLDTFLPIEIDQHVEQFFEPRDWQSLVANHTVAFGLNHSWFSSRRRRRMERFNRGRYDHSLLGQLLMHARESLRSPRIGVACPTFRRPELLAQLIWCFEQQTYPNKTLLAYDDSGELLPSSGENWEVYVGADRCESLGGKRNDIAQSLAQAEQCDIIVPWDDDDLAMPWALKAIADALEWSDWSRPSLALVPHVDRRGYLPIETFSRDQGDDKAFHPSWGYAVGAFNSVGGYPIELSHGEDLGLAKRLRDAGVSECDPMELGHKPYYLFGPHDNEHFGYYHKNYETWPERLASTLPVRVHPQQPVFGLDESRIRQETMRRSFQSNWWESDQQ